MSENGSAWKDTAILELEKFFEFDKYYWKDIEDLDESYLFLDGKFNPVGTFTGKHDLPGIYKGEIEFILGWFNKHDKVVTLWPLKTHHSKTYPVVEFIDISNQHAIREEHTRRLMPDGDLGKLQNAYKHSLYSEELMHWVIAKNDYTLEHSFRVWKYMRVFLQNGWVQGFFTEDEMQALDHAALLHDIGKVNCRDKVFEEKKLSDREFFDVNRHAVVGPSILNKSPSLPLNLRTLPILMHHLDPVTIDQIAIDILPDDKNFLIPFYMGTALLKLADCLDAITSHRVYSNGMDMAQGIKKLQGELLSFADNDSRQIPYPERLFPSDDPQRERNNRRFLFCELLDNCKSELQQIANVFPSKAYDKTFPWRDVDPNAKKYLNEPRIFDSDGKDMAKDKTEAK